MMQPKVSILIPCYNAEKWIAQSIQSALDQTHQNKEVIVVDDGSTDGSLNIIKQFGKDVISETGPNKGGNVARNRLLALSTGDWIQYLDADDYLLPTKIENQVNALDTIETDILYSPSLLEFNETNTITRKTLPIPEPRDPYILLARWYLPQTGSPLWKKQAILDVGGWKADQPVCQEHELYLRLLMGGKKFKFYPKAESVYRQWSETTLWKKNQSFTRKHRLIIEERLEGHLIDTGLMTKERQWAINMAKFETARKEWHNDQHEARRIISTINTERGKFLPMGDSAPLKYRLIYTFLGFSAAEKIAHIMRRGE
jgi:glycosyltransferase involved in cell wall biosynthesis